MTLSEKLIDFRARRELTQKDAAELLNVSRETLIAIENEKRNILPTTKRKIEIYIENNQ